MELFSVFVILEFFVVWACAIPTHDVSAVETSINLEELDHDDIILTNEQKRQLHSRKIFPSDSNLWISGNKPTVINYSLDNIATEVKKTLIREGIKEFEQHTCVSFSESSTAPYINFYDGVKCYSVWGKNVSDSGFQNISIADRCAEIGMVLHEIGHSLGFYHEHQRSDRDDHVEILEQNTVSSWNYFFKKENTRNYGVPYDYYSVMHGRTNIHSANGLLTILSKPDPTASVFMGQNRALSFFDKKIVNVAYKCIAKWMKKCSVTEDPCQNDGYLGSNCKCVCRPGTEGTNCEKETKTYYDALDDADDRVARSVIRTSGSVASDPKNELHAYHIIAPACHTIKFTIGSFRMNPPNIRKDGTKICNREYLSIRTDLSSTIHTMSCGKFLSPGTVITSSDNEMFLLSKMLPSRKSKSQWKGEISFQKSC